MRATAFLIATLLASPAPVLAQAVEQYTGGDWNARDLPYLLDWFEGRWDNDQQTYFEADRRWNLDPELRHLPVHAVHVPIDAPALGEHVFYVEEWKERDPDDTIRQRVFVFESEPAERQIRMKTYFLRDQDAAKGAWREPERLAGLTEDALFALEGCDVIWRRQAGQFYGEIEPEACTFGDPLRWSQHQIWLAEERMWRVDRTFNVETGDFQSGHPTEAPYEFHKANPYLCDFTFNEGFYGAFGGLAEDFENAESQRILDVPMHDQGGIAEVVRERDGLTYSVRLRTRWYPYYPADEADFKVLQLRRHEEAGVRPLAWTVIDADAEMIALNVTDMSVLCTARN